MQQNKNIPYYLIAAVFFVVLKYSYTLASTNDLLFLLKPTNTLVGFLTGSSSRYFSESGFFYESLNIVIDKSCSGFNFWILCFLLFVFVALKYFDKPLHKSLTIPGAFLGAYMLSLFANTSRIFASIIMQTQTQTIFVNHQHTLHEAIGIITNLSFLVLAYILIEKILIYTKNNAKFT